MFGIDRANDIPQKDTRPGGTGAFELGMPARQSAMSPHAIICILAAILLGSCAGNHHRELADLKLELQTERDLLNKTRSELQAVMKKLEPLLALANLVDDNFSLAGVMDDDSTDYVSGNVTEEEQPARSVTKNSSDTPLEGIVKVSDHEFRIPRKTLDELLADPMRSAGRVRIVPSIKNGNPNGFKLYAVRPSSVFAKLGFQNGDTIHEINGVALASAEKALEVYSKLQSADEFVVTLTRRGQPHSLRIVVQ